MSSPRLDKKCNLSNAHRLHLECALEIILFFLLFAAYLASVCMSINQGFTQDAKIPCARQVNEHVLFSFKLLSILVSQAI